MSAAFSAPTTATTSTQDLGRLSNSPFLSLATEKERLVASLPGLPLLEDCARGEQAQSHRWQQVLSSATEAQWKMGNETH